MTDGRTDGQTDRRTDRILIARPRLHCMQRGKNWWSLCTASQWRSHCGCCEDQKFHIEEVDPTNYSSSQKTRLNDLSHGIKIWTDLSSVLSQITRLTDGQTERRTDGRTAFSSLYRVCIPCSAVKIQDVQCVSKNIPDIFSCNLRKHCWIFTMFGTHVTEKVSNQQLL